MVKYKNGGESSLAPRHGFYLGKVIMLLYLVNNKYSRYAMEPYLAIFFEEIGNSMLLSLPLFLGSCISSCDGFGTHKWNFG